MSIIYCEYCHLMIDTDYNAEHFDDAGNCVTEKKANKWDELIISTPHLDSDGKRI